MSSKMIQYNSGGSTGLFSVRYEDNTLWMTQKQVALLFSKSPTTIRKHFDATASVNNFDMDTVRRYFKLAQLERGYSVERDILHYNIDAIVAIGHRTSGVAAIKFEKWAKMALKKKIKNVRERVYVVKR
jgi:hypothetical protein